MYVMSIKKIQYTLIGEDNNTYRIMFPVNSKTHSITVEQIKRTARLRFNQFMKDVIGEEIVYSRKTKETVTEKRRKLFKSKKSRHVGYHVKNNYK